MTYTDVQQQQRLDDWFPGLRADMDRLRAGNAELRAALAAAELSLQLIAADNRDLEDAHRRIAELEAKLAAAIARAEAAEAELAAWRRRSTKAERHVELLKKELDSVPVAALSILADAVDDTPDDVTQWLAWAELGAHWQPADQPCPDCEANALAVAVHADGEIEQWLCEECGYVAAEIKDRSAT